MFQRLWTDVATVRSHPLKLSSVTVRDCTAANLKAQELLVTEGILNRDQDEVTHATARSSCMASCIMLHKILQLGCCPIFFLDFAV